MVRVAWRSMKPADRLTELFIAASRAVSTATNAELKRRGVSNSQYECMSHLAAAESLAMTTMTAIAEKMGHSTAASTGLIDRLAIRDFVKRHPAPCDRRRINVELTQAGRMFLAEMSAVVAQVLDKPLASIPAKDITEFGRIAELLAARLTA